MPNKQQQTSNFQNILIHSKQPLPLTTEYLDKTSDDIFHNYPKFKKNFDTLQPLHRNIIYLAIGVTHNRERTANILGIKEGTCRKKITCINNILETKDMFDAVTLCSNLHHQYHEIIRLFYFISKMTPQINKMVKMIDTSKVLEKLQINAEDIDKIDWAIIMQNLCNLNEFKTLVNLEGNYNYENLIKCYSEARKVTLKMLLKEDGNFLDLTPNLREKIISNKKTVLSVPEILVHMGIMAAFIVCFDNYYTCYLPIALRYYTHHNLKYKYVPKEQLQLLIKKLMGYICENTNPELKSFATELLTNNHSLNPTRLNESISLEDCNAITFLLKALEEDFSSRAPIFSDN